MRESNFAFPTQNKACVCITSQLYDRRALDTTSPLPLLNSLTHLTYLTSTSPRIREIMTMDGGLERLVRILHDFCISPPPPENPALLYGLTPPPSTAPRASSARTIHPGPIPALNPLSFDRQAAYRFSLAFQCLVNIGVRGSEPIRSRVVQAGTLDVVGCVLEAWLAGHGFAVVPSASTTGAPRESREQRQARRDAIVAARLREREEGMFLEREVQRRLQLQARRAHHQEDQVDPPGSALLLASNMAAPSASNSTPASSASHTPATGGSDTEMSTDADISAAATPGTGTPTITSGPGPGTVGAMRDRSGTIVAVRPTLRDLATTRRAIETPPETDTSRPETETEAEDDDVDVDGDVNMSRGTQAQAGSSTAAAIGRNRRSTHSMRTSRVAGGPAAASGSSPEREQTVGHTRRPSRTVAVGGAGAGDAHIVINDSMNVNVPGVGVGVDPAVGVGGLGVGMAGLGEVEDGIVSLEPNDDFAMGAPPGAPGALVDVVPPNVVAGGNESEQESVGDGPQPAIAPIVPLVPAIVDATPRPGIMHLPPNNPATVRAAGATATVEGDTGNSLAQARQRGPGHIVIPATATLRPYNHPHDARNRQFPVHGERGTTITATTATPTFPVEGTARDNTIVVSTTLTTHMMPTGPYRDEDVLLSLQLLAYLSKYPHVRQAFYKPRERFHPATTMNMPPDTNSSRKGKDSEKERAKGNTSRTKEKVSGKEGVKNNEERVAPTPLESTSSTATIVPAGPSSGAEVSTTSPPPPRRQTNVFSLVERFTYKPSNPESDGGRLPPEIQYWAGVIMRNACRKDESRGGVRQCANMLCGRWEKYPREFAKCRRCRKAKYCGKECQSTAWSEGHRFWCSAKDVEDDGTTATAQASSSATVNANGAREQLGPLGTTIGIDLTPHHHHHHHHHHRERERHVRDRERALATAGAALIGPGTLGAETWRERERGGHHHHFLHERQQQAVLISQPRYVPGDLRLLSGAGTGQTGLYGGPGAAFEAFEEQQNLQQGVGMGRRRAETMGGAAMAAGTGETGFQQTVTQPAHPASPQPVQTQTAGTTRPFFGLQMFGFGGGARTEANTGTAGAGPSRWIRSFQSQVPTTAQHQESAAPPVRLRDREGDDLMLG